MVVDVPLKLSNDKVLKGNLLHHIGLVEEYAIVKTQVSSDDRCKIPAGTLRFPITLDLEFHLYTKSSVKTIPVPQQKTQQEMKNMSIAHSYELKNMGPSITNDSYTFSVVVAKDLSVKVTGAPNSTVICKLASVRWPDADLDSVLGSVLKETDCSKAAQPKDSSVSGITQFLRHDCVIEKGWKTATPYYIIIEMDFSTNVVPKVEDEDGKEKLSDIFVLPTFVKTKEECVAIKTEFISKELGELIAVKRMWPIFLGAGIALILCIALIVVLWKMGCMDRMRFFNNKTE